MKKLSNEYVSSFCLEMSLLIHSGIGVEDGLYLLIEDEEDKKIKEMLNSLVDKVAAGQPFSESLRIRIHMWIQQWSTTVQKLKIRQRQSKSKELGTHL